MITILSEWSGALLLTATAVLAVILAYSIGPAI